MGKQAKVFSFSAYHLGNTQEEILKSIQTHLEEIRHSHPDLVCIPEEVLISTGDSNNPNWIENNRQLTEMCRQFAREVGTYFVVNPEVPAEGHPGMRYNTAYVIDRSGTIIGQYRKRHITFRAIAKSGLPGERFAVIDTDIGRIGLMICFDVGWRDDWKKLADMGADMIVWPSAYHGGNLLNAYAALHMYYVVTSVWDAPSRIIDPFGRTIAQSSPNEPFVSSVIDPGAPIYHLDWHEQIVPQLRAVYGDRLSIRLDDEAHVFQLASRDPALDVQDLETQYGLTTYRAYHERYTRENDSLRSIYPELP
ncbi:MAG: carbon-nitrogen hydrolase family protein [Clostridia bacterium]|nr:carbon-nitrogen hydrolase family protein [Clostridia bacterium]